MEVEAKAVLERHEGMLQRIPVVQGFFTDVRRGRPVIVLLLSRKPRPGEIPMALEGIKVVPEVIGPMEFLVWNQRVRPAIGGISAINARCEEIIGRKSAGTIGSIVTIGNKYYVASNNHVLALFNQGSLGDPIIQPGSCDQGGAPDDTIAYLHSFREILEPPAQNKIDFALAEVQNPELVDTLIMGTKPAPEVVASEHYAADAVKNVPVFKAGRTTEITRGLIMAPSARIFVSAFGKKWIFEDVALVLTLEIGSFARGGDSGSPILSPGGKLLGYLFAGSPFATAFCKINNILDWIFEEFKFRPSSYLSDLSWVPPSVGTSLVSGGIAIGPELEGGRRWYQKK